MAAEFAKQTRDSSKKREADNSPTRVNVSIAEFGADIPVPLIPLVPAIHRGRDELVMTVGADMPPAEAMWLHD